jgi:hypothetical protein
VVLERDILDRGLRKGDLETVVELYEPLHHEINVLMVRRATKAVEYSRKHGIFHSSLCFTPPYLDRWCLRLCPTAHQRVGFIPRWPILRNAAVNVTANFRRCLGCTASRFYLIGPGSLR